MIRSRSISCLLSITLIWSAIACANPSSFSALRALSPRQSNSATDYLVASAIYTNSENNSAFQCWEFKAPLNVSAGAGTVGAETFTFFDLANLTYTHIPPRFAGGVHNSPAPQIVMILSGLAQVTLPHGSETLWAIGGGTNGLFFAVDSVGTGHNTTYPSDEESNLIQIPFSGGMKSIPPHKVLHEGPCDEKNGQVVSS
ncbi:hypothetical protein NA57DRAFT_59954 [Rhizodiscina lignyota]|uniref:Cupin type-1 domain-containing protein n=1 Tax=Rhizodiscina lignyota TaxID=1504668 RepID=A0A9P4M316_9PEZI|nr:hypothetical protein NA57DRAFT_59954 [Rhizodiscina lignyota]